jgi:FixJ family two-component response regulator
VDEAARKLRVILLDDEDPLVRAGVRLLERAGCAARGFLSPSEALAALRAAPSEVDAFFTDLSMPEQSGVEVARAVAAVRADLPIVVCSGTSRLEVGELGIPNPVHWLDKPFSREELTALLSALRSAS